MDIHEPKKPEKVELDVKIHDKDHKQELKLLQKEIKIMHKDEAKLEKEKKERMLLEKKYQKKVDKQNELQRKISGFEKLLKRLSLKSEQDKGELINQSIEREIERDHEEALLMEEKLNKELAIKKLEEEKVLDNYHISQLEQDTIRFKKIIDEDIDVIDAEDKKISKLVKDMKREEEQEKKLKDTLADLKKHHDEEIINRKIQEDKLVAQIDELRAEKKELDLDIKNIKLETKHKLEEKDKILTEHEKKITEHIEIQKELEKKIQDLKNEKSEQKIKYDEEIKELKTKQNVDKIISEDHFSIEYKLVRNKIIKNEVESAREEYKKLSELYNKLPENKKQYWWPDLKIIIKSLTNMRKANEPIPKSQYFILHDGKSIKDLTELSNALQSLPSEIFNQFVTEEENHFANWIEHVVKSKDLANKIRNVKSKEEMIEILNK